MTLAPKSRFVASEMTAEEHWARFTDFATFELAAGGPDPHMRYLGWMSQGEDRAERAWRCGLYAGVYSLPSAEVIWQHWPWEQAQADPTGLGVWIVQNWKGLRLRRERRAVRTPAKLAGCLAVYIEWARDLDEICAALPADRDGAYEEMWREAMSLRGFGRYAATKLLEALYRYADVPSRMRDHRPVGGWSPRRTMARLGAPISYSEAEANTYGAVRRALWAEEWVSDRLEDRTGWRLDPYRLEVLLCNYRQSFEGGWHYPGRSNDNEMEYHEAIRPYWGDRLDSRMWEARAALIPPWALGEHEGWHGMRDELSTAPRHGYVWSDGLYNREHTTDLASPVLRHHPTPTIEQAVKASLALPEARRPC